MSDVRYKRTMPLAADLRHALRLVGRQPALAAFVVLTLALGLGATTAIFSVVRGLLLRPAPFHEPERLVIVRAVRGDETGPLAVPELDDLKALPQFEDAAMYTDQGMYNASGFGTPEELPATITNHNLFRVLGVAPLVGQAFPGEFDRTRNFGLVISHGLWVRRFGSDPAVVGRTMTLDGAPGYVIYGVMPPGFAFPSQADLYRSSGISPSPDHYRRRDVRGMMVVARLKPGVTLAQARDAVAALGRRLEREFPATNGGLRFDLRPVDDMYRGALRPYVLLLFGAVGLLLLIACTNVANLLLARAVAREREMAVRAALGAERAHLIRQLLVESAVYSGLGAAGGTVLAWWGVRALVATVPVVLPPWMRVEIDWTAGAFMVAITAIVGAAAGVLPAFSSQRRDLHLSLKDGARGSAGTRQRRLGHVLVVAEVALALVLLVGAGLLIRTLAALDRVPLGFDRSQALTFRVELGWAAYGTLEKTTTFHRSVLDALRALPGVRAVTFDHNLPMSGKPRDPQPVRVYGRSADEEARLPFVNLHQVGPDYFRVMGIDLRQGRGFTDGDRPDTVAVAVVGRRAAERLWPGQDPLGQRFQLAGTTNPDAWLTVVGVSESVLHQALDGEPGLDVYRPFTQSSTAGPYYLVRTSGDPAALAHAATAIIGRIDPNQSFLDVQTYDGRLTAQLWQRTLSGRLFTGFALIALLLAAVGLYGVISRLVAQQTRDIGVRMALGAARGHILRLVLGRGLALAGAGATAGLLLAYGLARALSDLLFGVPPLDVPTFATMAVLTLGVAGMASYVPARRAMRIDPLRALKFE